MTNARAYRLKRVYGITEDQYDELLARQGHKCALCERPEDEFKTRLAVDHDHITGYIRGLLCSGCNYRVLGRHRDGDLLRRMAAYVEQHTGWKVPDKKRRKKRRKRK